MSSFRYTDVIRLLMSAHIARKRFFLSNKDEFGYEGGLSLFLSDSMATAVRYVKLAYVAPEQLLGQGQLHRQEQQQFLEVDDFFDGGGSDDGDDDEDEDDDDDEDGFDDGEGWNGLDEEEM